MGVIDKNAVQLRAMVLLSKGSYFFSQGTPIEGEESIDQRDAETLRSLLCRLHYLQVYTIAVVREGAMGRGLGFLAACDHVIASPTANFAFTEVHSGSIPAIISPYVNQRIGPRKLRRLAMSGCSFSASRALEIGLVDEVVDNIEEACADIWKNLHLSDLNAMRAVKNMTLRFEENLGRTLGMQDQYPYY